MKPQPALESDAKSPRLEIPRSRREGTLLLYLTAAALAWSVAASFIPLYFQDALSLGPSIILLLGAVQSLGAAVFAILLGRRADARSQGGTMALGLVLSSAGLIGVLLARNPLFSFPLVFFIGSARAPSLVGYSILSTVRNYRGAGEEKKAVLLRQIPGDCQIIPDDVMLPSGVSFSRGTHLRIK